jgi:hypothetical protein
MQSALTRRSPGSRRLGIAPAGVVGTLLLHALVMLPFFLDLSLPSRHVPNKSGAGASALVSAQEPVMTVVFINEPSTVERKTALEPEVLASRGLAPVDLPIVVLSPDALPAADAANREQEHDNSAPEAAGDQAQHAILYGRYLGQVQARIERAWMRPRTAIGAPRFSCRVRIEQNRQGNLSDIKLDHCNGGARWQHSLTSAIQTASPFPAPPDPSVYADRLWLTFRSDSFRPGGSAEGFEPEAAAARDALWGVTSSIAGCSHWSTPETSTHSEKKLGCGSPDDHRNSNQSSVLELNR